jgi:hypothetical protein
MRTKLALAAAALLVLAGCSSRHLEQARFGLAPICTGDSLSRTILVAQSVPTAEFIPCYSGLPAGLELKAIDVDSAGSRFLFDIDRYDQPVWMRFTTMCGMETMELEPPDAAGLARFAGRSENGRVAAGRTFPGGCLVFEFGEDSLIDTAEARALLEAVHLISRDDVRDLSGWELPGGE